MRKLAAAGTPVLGVCGGYQMLGQTLRDPEGVEQKGEMRGMGLLPCETEFTPSKARTRTAAKVLTGPFAGAAMEGYEIHMGRTKRLAGQPLCRLENGQEEGAMQGNVFGTYLHGLFDEGSLTEALASWLLARKGIEQEAFRTYLHGLFDKGSLTEALASWLLARKGIAQEAFRPQSHREYQQSQYDLLADAVRASLDLDTRQPGSGCGLSGYGACKSQSKEITQNTQSARHCQNRQTARSVRFIGEKTKKTKNEE